MTDLAIKILEKQTEMALDIKEIKVSLAYHIKRTDLLEESVKLAKEQLAIDMAPIKSHVLLLNTILKIAGGLSFSIGLAVGILKLIEFLT